MRDDFFAAIGCLAIGLHLPFSDFGDRNDKIGAEDTSTNLAAVLAMADGLEDNVSLLELSTHHDLNFWH